MKKICLAVLAALVFTPVYALAAGAAFRLLWGWFVAAEYGPGPSIGAWVGISTILGLIVHNHGAQVSDRRDKSDASASSVIGVVIGRLAAIGVILVVARFVGAVFGWIE